MFRHTSPWIGRVTCALLALGVVPCTALGETRIAFQTQWLSMPLEEFHRLVKQADRGRPWRHGDRFAKSRHAAD